MMPTLKLFKKDFYQRIENLNTYKGRKVLDLGCGDGEDAIEISKYAKQVIGLDIIRDKNWDNKKNKNVKFVIGKGEKLPFKDNSFNGLFLKDVLHHVQDIKKTMKEIKRVTTDDAVIIFIEGNRYNPLFYIHMTKMRGHDHLTQKQFKNTILRYFPQAKFISFESHFIPYINERLFFKIIKIEKYLSKILFLRPLLSYNAAIINGTK